MKKGDYFPLPSTGKTRSGVLSPVLGSPVQKRHGHRGVSQGKTYKDDERTGVSAAQFEVERDVIV